MTIPLVALAYAIISYLNDTVFSALAVRTYATRLAEFAVVSYESIHSSTPAAIDVMVIVFYSESIRVVCAS